MRRILLSLAAIIGTLVGNAQCDWNVMGTFDGSNYNSWTYYPSQSGIDYGTFSQESNEKYGGSNSLRAKVTTTNTWQMRMLSTCDYPLSEGTIYSISFWAKGNSGDKIKVSIQSNDAGTNELEASTIELASSTWEQHTVNLTSDGDYTRGKLRFNFQDIGTYYLDEITFTETNLGGTSSAVAPNDPNLRYTGVGHLETNATKAIFYRFTEAYSTNNHTEAPPSVPNWTQYAVAKRGAASAGITIQFKTDSKFITAKFVENTTYTEGIYTLAFAVYKNGEFFQEFTSVDDNVEFQILNTAGDMAEWTITMPGYGHMEFLGLEIEDGKTLQALPIDDRPVYVAIGNSITHGIGQTNTSTHRSYAWQVADELGYQLYNWGIGGSKIYDGVFDNFANTGVTPDVVSVLWGYNDVNCGSCSDQYFTEVTLGNYETLITDVCTTYPDAKVVGILPTFTTTTFSSQVKSIENLRVQQKAILDQLVSNGTCSAENVAYFEGDTVTDANSLSDAVHMNDLGATQIADAIISVLGGASMPDPDPIEGDNWYVCGGCGADNMNGSNGHSTAEPLNTLAYAVKTAWQPGDTIFVMDGVYRNAGFGDYQTSGGTSGLNNNAFLQIWDSDINTSENGWLVITNAPGHTPKIEFDGSGGLIFQNTSYVDVSGLEIEGPNQKISKSEALANRLEQDKYFSGRGIAVWGAGPHHIKFHHMKVHDCPNSGLRVNNGDYVTMTHNEVYNCTWWSSNAESAIVIAQSKDYDDLDKIKMVMSYNIVHDNRNFIPYYNPSYTGNEEGNGPCYGLACQDYIIDGSGVYITRNNPGSPSQSQTDYLHGWFYFANNIAFNNGINGLVVHKTDRTIVTNNLAFMNGTVNPDPVSAGGEGRQNAGGITLHTSNDVFVYNNISWVTNANDFSYQNYGSSQYTASNNIGVNGKSAFTGAEFTTYADTDVEAINLFEDKDIYDFHPSSSSVLIDAGTDHADLPIDDFEGNTRDAMPDIGPYEFQDLITAVHSAMNQNKVSTYPNPTKGQVHLEEEMEYSIINAQGEVVEEGIGASFDLSNQPDGIYILKTDSGSQQVIKY